MTVRTQSSPGGSGMTQVGAADPRWGRTPSWRMPMLCVVAIAGAVAIDRGFGLPAVGGFALLVVGAAIWLLRQEPAPTNVAPSNNQAQGASVPGRELEKQVLPVWRRQIESARGYSDTSMAELLTSFSSMTMQLDEALGTQGAPTSFNLGPPEAMLAQHQTEIDLLTRTTRQVAQLKDEMLDTVMSLSDTLAEMTALSKEVQSVSRATHLLALNASVEATRAGESGGGFAVVAAEVRALAAQSREVGMQIGRHVAQMNERIQQVKTRVRRHDTDEDELLRQSEQNALAVLSALMGSVADASRASRALRDSSRAVQDEMEKISMSLQSQDRLSQMLTAVTEDMQRLVLWLNGADDPAALHPVQWLERLEASYTMEEMKASHHNLVAVQQSSGVQFF